MTLGELIEALEKAPHKERPVRWGFGAPHSSRGFYEQLAFDPAENVSIASMLAYARSAVGATFQGWKGGDFTMTEASSPLWIEVDGNWDSNSISPQLVNYWLATTENEAGGLAGIRTQHR